LKNATTGAVLAISATANETTVSRSNGTVTVGLPDDVTVTGQLNVGENVVVSGNLVVSGTTTTVNSETVNIADNIIVLNSNETGTPSQNGGITIERGTATNYSFLFDETTNNWTLGDRTLTANTFIGNLTGSASAVDDNSVALGTKTTGNYVATIAAGNGIDVSGSGSETAAVTISIESDLRNDVTKIGPDNNDFYDITSTSHDWYLDGVLDMRLENDGDLHIDGDLDSNSSTTSSDIKLKTDINVVDNALEKIEQLNGVEFTWIKNGNKSAGVIAQDVLEVLPQAVKEVSDLNSDDSHLSVNYDALHALLIEAVKELSAKVKELESK
jgi:hypothetical protein